MEQTQVLNVVLKKKISGKSVAGKIGVYILLIALAVFFIFPTFVMIMISILPDNEIPLQVLFSPSGTIYLGAYVEIFTGSSSDFMRYLFNSLLIGGITAVGVPFMAALCAYGFAKMEFKGKEILFGIVLSTMMIPSVVTLIPLQTIFMRLGWDNTTFPMWVPGLFGGGAVNIFLIRQFMRGIPNDMVNAAKIDGANSFLIFIRFMVPLCFPIMIYVAVNSFIGSWSDFITPMTYLGSADNPAATLALGIYEKYGPNNTRIYANVSMAAGVLMTFPLAVLFFVFQRSLIEGVAVTGLKG